MPPDFVNEPVEMLAYLLPGLLAAWVFYGLTSHPKPSQFERIVQALVFTFVVQVLTPLVRWVFVAVGNYKSLGEWSTASDRLTQLGLALALGALLAYLTNTDTVHRYLRKRGFTTRTAHPSEWYCVFSTKVTYVILHLVDGRRLYGWPKEWPVERDKGQFYIMEPSWIIEEERLIDLPELDGILVGVEDIRWVEFVKFKELDNEQSTD